MHLPSFRVTRIAPPFLDRFDHRADDPCGDPQALVARMWYGRSRPRIRERFLDGGRPLPAMRGGDPRARPGRTGHAHYSDHGGGDGIHQRGAIRSRANATVLFRAWSTPRGLILDRPPKGACPTSLLSAVHPAPSCGSAFVHDPLPGLHGPVHDPSLPVLGPTLTGLPPRSFRRSNGRT